jgi:hypothetical protein
MASAHFIKKDIGVFTMVTADYLHRQAEACLRIGRTAFDLATAERLRLLAAELRAKANEVEEQAHEAVEPI